MFTRSIWLLELRVYEPNNRMASSRIETLRLACRSLPTTNQIHRAMYTVDPECAVRTIISVTRDGWAVMDVESP